MSYGNIRQVLWAVLAILITIPAFSQDKKAEKDESFQEMLSLINGASYVFSVQSVNPVRGRTIHPTTKYTFEARDSIFMASLPYFGRAYQATYGGNGGIEFKAPAENLRIRKNERKRQINISFRIRGENDTYDINLSVGYKGYGTLNVTPVKRQPIAYYGSVGPVK